MTKQEEIGERDFESFQKYFKEYIEAFGLHGYRVYFRHEPLTGLYAETTINHDEMVAIITFNSNIHSGNDQFKDIRLSAKHEAIHLLLGRLEALARFRFISKSELDEASEEIAHKLEVLIKED